MTRRGWLTLLLGAATYVVAWLFGIMALYPVATGLVLAPIAAVGWVWLAAGPMRLQRSVSTSSPSRGYRRPASRSPRRSLALATR